MRGRSGNSLVVALIIGLALLVLRGGIAGRDAPDFSLRGAYGRSIEKESFRGKPVLLVFWTTSCPVLIKKFNKNVLYKDFVLNYKLGLVYFENQRVKKAGMKIIQMCL
jgi:hypothetical protein